MTNSQEYEVHVLNELIVATLDCAQKFRNAAFAAGQRGAALFMRCAIAHMQAVEQLASQVRHFNAKPATVDSIVAATLARRAPSEDAAHAPVELRKHFEAAIQDIRISDLVRSVIRTAFERIGDDSWPATR